MDVAANPDRFLIFCAFSVVGCSLSSPASLAQQPATAAHEEDNGKGRQINSWIGLQQSHRKQRKGEQRRKRLRMWGGRSHNAAMKGGAAPPGKGKSNGERRPPPPALDDDRMPQDGGEREGQGATLSPLPPPRPWKVPGSSSDAQPAARKGAAAAAAGAADGDRWRSPGEDRREAGAVGKGPLPGRVTQSGPSRERRDPRSFSPRVVAATAAPYVLDNDRGGGGPDDGFNGGGGGNNVARNGTSSSAAVRGAGMGAEARGQDARTATGVGGEQRAGGKATVPADGSGRPANIIRIRIPPPSGQPGKATGRPSEANRFSNDKDKDEDLRPARSSGNSSSSSHPAPSGRIRTTISLGGRRTPPSSGGAEGGFDGGSGGGGDAGGSGDRDAGGGGGGIGGGSGSGGDAVAEGVVRDDEPFGEMVSMFPGKTGRKKKNPVPTRAGGRTRTP